MSVFENETKAKEQRAGWSSAKGLINTSVCENVSLSLDQCARKTSMAQRDPYSSGKPVPAEINA